MRTMFRVMLIMIAAGLILGAAGSVLTKRAVPKNNNVLNVKSIRGAGAKKVILLLADSLMYQAIDKGIEQNELPTFKYLTGHGTYHKDVVTTFPTMSVTIDSTLLTGTQPDEHRVPGLVWYSSNEKRVINYGMGPWEVIKQGLNSVLPDVLINLNGLHLNPQTETIHETLARLGLTSGSINGLIYRGTTEHTLSIPAWVDIPTSLPKQLKVRGPAFFSFGALANPLEGLRNVPEGLASRLGFNNEYAFQTAKYLIETNQLPDLLIMYLPDFDKEVHNKGPSALDHVKKLDSQLKSFLETFGSIDKALQEVVFIVLGDNGMATVNPAGQRPIVELRDVLGKYNILPTGAAVDDKTQIVLAVNDRMAYVYLLDPGLKLQEIADRLKKDSGIDVIAWKEGEYVAVARNGYDDIFHYKAKGVSKDMYGQTWTTSGSLDIVDASFDKNNRITFGQYPDALQRIYSALHSHEGDFLIVSAKEGFELADRYSPTHEGGGGHGSLDEAESLVPIIICGTEQDLKSRRIIDIKDYLLRLLVAK